jgi:hypothetical protein
LSEAYWYAKILEQSIPSVKKFTNFTPQNKTNKQEVKDKPLSAQTFAELKVAGKCFKCKEPWVPSHAKTCKAKQVYSVILVENGEGKEEAAVFEDIDSMLESPNQEQETLKTCKNSAPAINGSPIKVETITFKLEINGHMATALVDSGSDASFINSKFAVKANWNIIDVDAVQVATTQGQVVISSTATYKCDYTI